MWCVPLCPPKCARWTYGAIPFIELMGRSHMYIYIDIWTFIFIYIYIWTYIFRALRGSWSIYEGTSGPSGFVVNISRYFGFSKVVDLAESFRMRHQRASGRPSLSRYGHFSDLIQTSLTWGISQTPLSPPVFQNAENPNSQTMTISNKNHIPIPAQAGLCFGIFLILNPLSRYIFFVANINEKDIPAQGRQ